jgi:hypothetical protein
MTLGQFREQTKELPDHLDIFMDERLTEFTYGLVNTAQVKEINFMEEPGGEILSTDNALVLSED